MSKINYKYNNSLINGDLLKEKFSLLEDYRGKLNKIVEGDDYQSLEASLVVPSDDSIMSSVKEVIDQTKTENLKYILVVGIGGSNLGTKAIYESLVGLEDPHTDRLPKLIFIDTVGQKLFEILSTVLKTVTSPEEVIVNIISKSGGTAETMFNGEVVYGMLEEKFGEEMKNRVVVTTNEGSPLFQKAEEVGVKKLMIPELVGGRYSVFSPVGLLPLGLAGFDIESLVKGAKDMRDQCLGDENNHALISSVITNELFKKGFVISNTFVFNPEMESIGRWYRQLMGESIGKKKNRDDQEVRTGIVPMVSIGSTDLHSMAQLYFGGPRNIFHTFLNSPITETVTTPNKRLFDGVTPMIDGVKNDRLMNSILEGTQLALVGNEIPFVNVTLEEISEYSLGEYLQFKMMEIMYLAELMNLNAFDQPSVEDYKIETKRILAEG